MMGTGGTYDVESTVDLTIGNVAPLATFSNSGPVLEGSDGQSVSVSFANPFDPSAADMAAGFTYDFFFGDDSSFDLLNVTTPSVHVPAALLVADGQLQVRGVIRDQDGATTEYQTSITILEDEPDILLAPASGSPLELKEGDDFLLDVTVIDQGGEPIDLVIVDWGDGFVESIDDISQPIPHAFADDGSRTVELSLWSDGIKYTQSLSVAVANANPLVTGLAATAASGASSVLEGDVVSLTGLLTDAGISDTLDLLIDWGDGIGAIYSIGTGRQFELNHTYANDGSYIISAIVFDDDSGISGSGQRHIDRGERESSTGPDPQSDFDSRIGHHCPRWCHSRRGHQRCV